MIKNMVSIRDYLLEDIKKPTQEMIDWYVKRTGEHIDRVRKNLMVMVGYDGLTKSQLENRGTTHDAVKYGSSQYLPYVWLSWMYHCKQNNIPFKYPKGVEDEVHKATKEHVHVESHHPESHSDPNTMTKLDIVEMCLTGDTKISLLNGTEIPIKDLVGRDKFWLYSCTTEGKIVPGLGYNVRKTKLVNQIYKITLDNNEIIECSDNHKFMLRDGSYKEAKNLNEFDSLMPLYRKISDKKNFKDYEMLYHLDKNKWELTHRMVVRECLGGYEKYVKIFNTNKVVCHHIKYIEENNKRNNDPSNLEVITRFKHSEVHKEQQKIIGSKVLKKLWEDDEFRKRSIKRSSEIGKITAPINITKYNKSESHRKLAAELICRINSLEYECPFCHKILGNKGGLTTHLKCIHIKDPDYIKKRSEIASINGAKAFEDDGFRLRIKEYFNTPVTCEECGKVCGNKPALGNHKKARHKDMGKVLVNHKVIKIEIIKEEKELFDISVNKYNNFALTSGVFVHNCADHLAMSQELGDNVIEWEKKHLDKFGFNKEKQEYILKTLDEMIKRRS